MNVKSGFELRDICGEKVLIATGIENVDFNQMISLNDTAAYLWNFAKKLPSFTEEQLAEALTKEYDVDKQTATNDVHNIIKIWQEQGVVV